MRDKFLRLLGVQGSLPAFFQKIESLLSLFPHVQFRGGSDKGPDKPSVRDIQIRVFMQTSLVPDKFLRFLPLPGVQD